MTTEEELELFSSPFSGTFFQSSDGLLPSNRLLACVFVPFIGDFFQLLLSVSYLLVSMFSSPLSGTFFNLSHVFTVYADNGDVFSSPLSGTFFNLFRPHSSLLAYFLFSSPLSGTFFNRGRGKNIPDGERNFRPLYRGLFSIYIQALHIMDEKLFSSPLSGTFFNRLRLIGILFLLDRIFVPFIGDFFQSRYVMSDYMEHIENFRPLYRGLFSISVPAKPQPVCSRKRIRGGDEGIASSGTLLRR